MQTSCVPRVCVCVRDHKYVCMCVCVLDKERCVCVCVCECTAAHAAMRDPPVLNHMPAHAYLPVHRPQVLPWLDGLLGDPRGRKLIYELSAQHRNSLLLNFAIQRIMKNVSMAWGATGQAGTQQWLQGPGVGGRWRQSGRSRGGSRRRLCRPAGCR